MGVVTESTVVVLLAYVRNSDESKHVCPPTTSNPKRQDEVSRVVQASDGDGAERLEGCLDAAHKRRRWCD